MVERVLVVRPAARWREFEDLHASEIPAVRGRNTPQLVGRLAQAHIERRFAAIAAFEQELEREGCLTGTRVALDEVKAVSGKTAPKQVVQAGYAGQRAKIRHPSKSYCAE